MIGCTQDPSTVVGAHVRMTLRGLPGAGGVKPHDGLIAFMCHLHHSQWDKRIPISDEEYKDLEKHLLGGLLMQRYHESLSTRKPS